ncbi:MAG: hypothetical protein GEEBNDBF_01877 [bacterium]|nr:hypothetical protein [bacterium]
MIHSLFADPQQYLTPESVVDDFLHLEEIALLIGCPRCASLHIKTLVVEDRRLTLCHDCGSVTDNPPPN